MFDVLEDGWTSFLPEVEYSKLLQNKEEWRISHVNKDYSVSIEYIVSVYFDYYIYVCGVIKLRSIFYSVNKKLIIKTQCNHV